MNGIYKKKLKNKKNFSDILRLYWLQQQGTDISIQISYIIIIVTYQKIYFYLYTISKQKLLWKI